jgi:hypothetical protein
MIWFCLARLLEAASKTRTALSATEFYALLFFWGGISPSRPAGNIESLDVILYGV